MADSNRGTVWTRGLLRTSQDRSASRVVVKKPYSSKLRGVDGITEGGLRPFPGFIQVHEFDGLSAGNHDTTSEIVEAWGVDFIIGEDGYGYGFVYRLRRKNQATGTSACDLYIDYYNSKLGYWVKQEVLKEGVPLPVEMDPIDGAQVTVTTWGQFIYVYIEGQLCVSFRTERDNPFYPAVVNASTGPGKRPSLVEPAKAQPLGSVTDPMDAERPGAGQVVLLQYPPSTIGLGVGSGSGHVSGSGDLEPWQDDEDARLLNPGGYSFSYVLHNSVSGLRSSLSDIATCQASDFAPGGSGSGADTQYNLYAAIEICYDSSKYDQAYIYRSVRVEGAGGTYYGAIMHLEAVINLEDYWTINNPLSGDLRQSIYYYQLEDKALASQDPFLDAITFDERPPKGGCAFFYEGTMVVSNIKEAGSSTADEVRPKDAVRGLGELRYSSLSELNPELFSPGNRWTPPIPSNTVIAFELTGPNLFGFSRDRMYLVRKESTYLQAYPMHDGFGVTGPHASDTVGSFIYFLTAKGMKTVDSQGQLEDVRAINDLVFGDWKDTLSRCWVAFDPVVSALCVHNPEEFETVFFWMNTAMVTELQETRFSCAFRCSWPSDFEFDRTAFRLDNGESNDTYKNPLTERVIFIENAPKESSSQATPGYRHRAFVIDYKRERTQVLGTNSTESRSTLLPYEGNSVFETAFAFTGTAFVNVLTLTVPVGAVLPEDCWNCMLYILESSDASIVGRSIVVRYRATSTQLTLGEGRTGFTIPAGTKVGLSPVFFEWVGSPEGLSTEEGQQFGDDEDFFRVRHFQSIGCAFTDVTGTGLDEGTIARFMGLAYRGSEADPAATAATLDRAGNEVISITDGEGTYYAAFTGTSTTLQGKYGVNGSALSAGVRIICPDVDFRMIGVRITGDVLATSRTQRAS